MQCLIIFHQGTSMRSVDDQDQPSLTRDGFRQSKTTTISNNSEFGAMGIQELEKVFEEYSAGSPPIIQPVEGVHY